MSKGYEDRADGWIAWARKPSHDAYAYFRDAFFSDGEYVIGAAEVLPFEAASFDLVVAYNSLMDVDDLAASVREISRVLADGGRFCACVTHPVRARGSWETRAAGEVYVMEHSYFGARPYRFEAARDGLEFTFDSRTYPLSDYANAIESAGLVIESLRQPVSRDAHDRFLPEFLLWRTFKR